MIRVVSALVTLLLGATALSRPVILQSTETIPSPDPTYTYFGYGLGIDGDWAIITGEKVEDPDDEYSAITQTAFLFRRVNSHWVFQRKLVEQQGYVGYTGPSGLAMREGIAVVLLGGLRIFELSGNDYVARNVSVGGEGLGSYIGISNRRILLGAGACAWDGVILEFSTANNRWQATTTLPGESKDGCDDDFRGGPVEISGDLAWVSGGGLFHRSGGTTWNSVPMWSPAGRTTFEWLDGIEWNQRIVSGSGRYGTHVLNRDANGAGQVQDHLQTVNGVYSQGNALDINPEGNLVFTSNYEEPYEPWCSTFSSWIRMAVTRTRQDHLESRRKCESRCFRQQRASLADRPVAAVPVSYLELPATLPTPPAVIQSTFNADAAGLDRCIGTVCDRSRADQQRQSRVASIDRAASPAKPSPR
jgi:hypothetical protein